MKTKLERVTEKHNDNVKQLERVRDQLQKYTDGLIRYELKRRKLVSAIARSGKQVSSARKEAKQANSKSPVPLAPTELIV